MKNYGLNLELEKQHQTEKDWVFGAFSQKCLALIPELEREKYLPIGEVQRTDIDDLMNCTSQAPTNLLETKFTYLYQNNKLDPSNKEWLEKNGYIENGRVWLSERFVSINAGNTKQGNSFKAPLEAIRTKGLIPKNMFPLEKWMTWEQYHDPSKITPSMYLLGQEFNRRFPTNYERAYRTYFVAVLKEDVLCVGGYAWPIPVNGVYQRVDLPPNHEFMGLKNPAYYIFDSYTDSVDGDYIKKLAGDYAFVDFGYRIYISKENVITEDVTQTISGNDRLILLQILQKMAQILQIDLLLLKLRGMLKGIFGKKQEPITPIDQDVPPKVAVDTKLKDII